LPNASPLPVPPSGEPTGLPKPHPHEPPLFMKLPVGLLAAACVLVVAATDWWLCFTSRQRNEIIAALYL